MSFDRCGTLWVLLLWCPCGCTCLKLINHFGIIKYSKEEGIRKGQVKEFLKFLWHDSLFHTDTPSQPTTTTSSKLLCVMTGVCVCGRISCVTLIVSNYTCISVTSIWGLCIPLGPSHSFSPSTVMAFKIIPFGQS